MEIKASANIFLKNKFFYLFFILILNTITSAQPNKVVQAQTGNEALYIASLVILLLIIVYLLAREKKQTNLKSEDQSLEDKFTELNEAYSELKKAFESLKEKDKKNLRKIKEFKHKIVELERVNVELLRKKTELEEKKAALEILQKKKDEMFAIAIHDIKNPINAIRGYIELIKSYDLTAKEQQEIMDSLASSADKIIKLSREMTDVINKGDFIPGEDRQEFSVKHIIDNICKVNSAYVKKKSIRLINHVQDNLPKIMWDPNKFEEVVDNLVNNAIKYGPPGTTVEIFARTENGRLIVEVKDDGVGLSKEDINKAFTRGGILTPKPTDNEPQSGLGLWLVKLIVEDRGGEVWIDSELGKGSTFAFSVPMK